MDGCLWLTAVSRLPKRGVGWTGVPGERKESQGKHGARPFKERPLLHYDQEGLTRLFLFVLLLFFLRWAVECSVYGRGGAGLGLVPPDEASNTTLLPLRGGHPQRETRFVS